MTRGPGPNPRALEQLDDDERRLIGPYLTAPGPTLNGEWRGFCALCENPDTSKSPSASYNFVRHEWNHPSAECGGSIGKLINELAKRERDNAREGEVVDINAARSRKGQSAPLPSDEVIAEYQKALRANKPAMQYLREERGLSNDTLKRFKVGWDSARKRFVIPIYGPAGELVNVRLYNRKPPNANVPKMMPFATGYGTQIYGFDSLAENEVIVLCEGEWDRMLNEQNGIPTVTHTGGAGAFQIEWAKHFAGKHVFICYDEDEGGVKGGLRTARLLKDVAAGVYIMTNLAVGKKGGDITDYYLTGATGKQFRRLMDEARETPFAAVEEDHVIPTSGRIVTVEESQNFDLSEPLELNVMVSGKLTPPYGAPRIIHAECDQSKGKACAICPMAAFDASRQITTQPDDQRLLDFIEANKATSRNLLRDISGAVCSDRIGFEVTQHWNVEELVIVQSVEERTEESSAPMNRKVFNVGTYNTRLNSGARIVGSQVTDPRNQRGLFRSWHLEPTQANIDRFRMTPQIRKQLKVFQPGPLEEPIDKLEDIALDLATNVTEIYDRPWLHIANDLVWHSAIGFTMGDKAVEKGWLDALIVGDTRTGKTQVAKRLAHHYHAGIVKSCEGSTFAGLVGGNTPMPQGKGFMVQWGVIPLNDRRLVVLDELSGIAEKDILADMSSVRSSGVAQITKIAGSEASARTRLLWLSNPVDGRLISETAGGGMAVIRNLVKKSEDIARFDFAFTVAQQEVSSKVINSRKHAKVNHTYTSELCSTLVMWVWSRRADQVLFDDDAIDAVLKTGQELGDLYIPEPPLVQAENIREKIARIAVAVAGRLFSTDRTGELIIVKPEHVDTAREFLNAVYASESMGYLRMSVTIRENRAYAELMRDRAIAYITNTDENTGLLGALQAVAGSESFRPRDFEEFGRGFDAQAAVAQLLQWRMIRRLSREGGRIAMEPTLIRILRDLENKEISNG